MDFSDVNLLRTESERSLANWLSGGFDTDIVNLSVEVAYTPSLSMTVAVGVYIKEPDLMVRRATRTIPHVDIFAKTLEHEIGVVLFLIRQKLKDMGWEHAIVEDAPVWSLVSKLDIQEIEE